MWRKFPGDADQHPRESGSSASLHTSLPARKEDAQEKITCRRERVWLDTYLVLAIVVVQSYQRTTLLYHTHTEVIISWYGWNNSLQSSKSLSQTPASGFSPQTAQKFPCVLASKPLHTRFCLTHSYSLNSAAKLPFCLSCFPQSFSILFSFPHIFHSPTSSFSPSLSISSLECFCQKHNENNVSESRSNKECAHTRVSVYDVLVQSRLQNTQLQLH